MIVKYTNIDRLISRVYSYIKPDDTISDMDIIEWSGECLAKLPINCKYEELGPIEIPLVNYKGILPNGFISQIQVGYKDLDSDTIIPMIQHTSTMVMPKEINRLEYIIIDDCYIQTTEEVGYVVMRYLSYPYDEKGFPKIPDDERVLEALVKYITMMYLYPKYLRNEPNMNNIYPQAVMGYNDAVRKLKAYDKMPKTIDDYEIMLRTQRTLVPNHNRFTGFFGSFNKNQFKNNRGSFN